MFICLCSPLTEDQVTEAIETGGARTTDEIFAYWESGENCGKCTFQMRMMIDNYVDQERGPVLPMAPPDPPPDND